MRAREKAAFVLVVTTAIFMTALAAVSSVSDDPYAPLKLYSGAWDLTMIGAGAEAMHIENHCTRTGLFFVCEQTLNGNPQGLTVFLPVAKLPSGGEEYKTLNLPADGSSSGGWGKVTIENEKWTYFWDTGEGARTVQWRNINQFSGTDKIHFEIQSSEDGTTWKIVKAGDEVRVTSSIPK
jgi:hypothetical protein